ncbi:MAG TPA: response regulator transcription factor [Anaerolineae bacterium]
MLVDDQPTVRKGLRMRLEAELDMRVIGEAKNGSEAVMMAQITRPDVAVVDVEMPDMDGIEAATAMRVLAPYVSVVVLSIHDDQATQVRARAAGVRAFVSKHDSTDALLSAIRAAASPRPHAFRAELGDQRPVA